jgi:AraC-like DNA-binding protein
MPGDTAPLTVSGPRLLILYQPPGAHLRTGVIPKLRETGLSLYCRPEYLRELARLSCIANWPLLEEIEKHPSSCVWLRQQELSPSLQYIATSLLESSYRWGIRLLHAEAKALDLLCQILAPVQTPTYLARTAPSQCESRQLDAARRLLSANLQAPPKIPQVARSVGMSESKLRRLFKLHLGVTIFEYAQSCRMRHALDLLRSRQLSVGQTSAAVGYKHQTSFASAFQDYFGFQPRKARSEMH